MQTIDCENRDVRKAVLTAIGMSPHTLQHVISRTKDVNEDVRAMTYSVFGKKVPLEKILPDDRITLLQEGLKDRHAFIIMCQLTVDLDQVQ
jgi:condensin complex subunit 3